MINLILTLILMLNGWASECPALVKAGEPAPCTGYVFTEEQEYKLRTDLELAKEESQFYKDVSELDKRLLELERDTSRVLKDELNRRESDAFWDKTFYFIFGVSVTAFGAYVGTQVIK